MYIARMNHKTGQTQSLEEHLQYVGTQAKRYAAFFDTTSFTEIAARLHDIGKMSDAFQQYIQNPNGKRGSVQHALPGASLVFQTRNQQSRQYLMTMLLANVIAGHHRGLYDQTVTFLQLLNANADALHNIAKEEVQHIIQTFDQTIPSWMLEMMERWEKDYLMLLVKSDVESMNVSPSEKVYLETFTRMALSAVVDADWSDAARFQKNELREENESIPPSFKDFQARYHTHLSSLRTPTERSEMLSRLQQQCEEKGKERNPSVELVLPTGYGKTLASLAYALEHAKKYQKNRIITALPLQNLTAETSELYRKIFGSSYVIEDYSLVHHQNVSDDERERLEIERDTWDRPFVVTTTVQLFESLFSNRPRALRKLHRIAGSIIILDEYHLLPMHLLEPILRQLDVLQERYDVTVVFVSATNLPLSTSQTIQKWKLKHLPKRLLPEVEEPRRVNYEWIPSIDDQQLVTKIDERATLCIVNTRRQSQALYQKMKEMHEGRELYYLSTTLVGKERQQRLQLIKESVAQKRRPIVVSTQVLEAGIDISFEVVYREAAPLPSIIQAAGRCNRYGEYDKGEVYIVEYANRLKMPSYYEAGISQVKTLMNQYGIEAFHSLEARASYYRRIVSNEANQHGLPTVPFLFETVANTFRMIDRSSVDVICTQAPTFDRSRLTEPKTRAWWREMQNFTVPLPKNTEGISEVDGIYRWDGFYDEEIGISLLKGGESV